ncbi:SDR family oxidoreductase [Sinisalibacter aestuarii]|uniref:Quinone oxidoreductase 2 n=1 Tax=Sinisalibacter aestuarii TaxID=2949426 RepID=A0ABQ5LZ15_9RHOB|nr:SDR family oxidoreductase [Sinisalibacter aestuarii]GKY90192.1 quinone oxidoreductase 2 [Sinisalibacter aestuarii]
MSKHLVTGASGQLGGHVLAALEGTLPKSETAVLVRKEEDRARLAGEGYDVRVADYSDPAALTAAFAGIDRLLLISGTEMGQRLPQHKNVIAAAKAAGVGFIAYTSILAADRSPMSLAAEHRGTEEELAASGLAYSVLRNGWYTENITASIGQDLQLGQHFGAAGTGRFAAAPRADYAEAAAAVLTGAGHEGKIYELGGSDAFTLSDYAATLSEIAGKPVAYVDMPEAAYAEALTGAGLPGPLADMLSDSDAKAADGWLYTESTDLTALIGHPTTPLAEVIKAALG